MFGILIWLVIPMALVNSNQPANSEYQLQNNPPILWVIPKQLLSFRLVHYEFQCCYLKEHFKGIFGSRRCSVGKHLLD